MLGRVHAPWGTKNSVNQVADGTAQVQDDYDVGGRWPPAPGAGCEVLHRPTGCLRLARAAAKDPEPLKQEIAALWALDHPNVLALFDVFEDSKAVYLITEHCEGGRLVDVMPKDRGLPEVQCAILAKQLLAAVRHMHGRQLCHRNLQLKVLGLKAKGPIGVGTVLKVGGFEMACKFDRNQALRALCGPVGYVAPEVLDKQYDNLCDMWSLGVVAYALLCGHLPFRGASDEDVARESYRGAFFFHPLEWADVSDQAKDLIRALLRKKPGQRPQAAEAYRHRWFKEAFRSLKKDDARKLGSKDPKAVGMDLELFSAPEVARDTFSPIHVNPSLKPTLIKEDGAAVRFHPERLEWVEGYAFEPWGTPSVRL